VVTARQKFAKAGVSVSLVAGALAFAAPQASALPIVPAMNAGTIEVWGVTDSGCLTPVRQTHGTEAGGPWRGVTRGGTGEVSAWAAKRNGQMAKLAGSVAALPASLTGVAVSAIHTSQTKAAAIDPDGAVHVWGDTRGFKPITGGVYAPTVFGGKKAVDVTLSTAFAAVALEDGTVAVINDADGVRIVPDLTDVVEVRAVRSTASSFRVRIEGGGLRQFAGGSLADESLAELPVEVVGDELEDPIVAFDDNAVVHESGAVADIQKPATGTPTYRLLPDDLVDGKVVDVATVNFHWQLVLSDDGRLAVWSTRDETDPCWAAMTTIPEDIAGGKRVTAIDGGSYTFAAIAVDRVRPENWPTIAEATLRPGTTLTGTPGTFIGEDVEVNNQWLADGEPIDGATEDTYELTDNEVGKKIVFRSVGTTEGGDESIADSDETAEVEPTLAPSSTTVSVSSKKYGNTGTAVVTVKGSLGRAATGKVTLSGAGSTQTKTVVGGRATFSLPKTLTAKTYTLTARYLGNAEVAASNRTARYAVTKTSVRSVSFKASKVPTSKKTGKAKVTVKTSSGLAKATGKFTVTFKKGSKKKTVKGKVSRGTASVKVPKLAKGTWRVSVSYAGDSNYSSKKSKTVKLKVKK
jgi:hypothetical protein